MSISTIVFDLDGVLANCDHRVHLAQAKDWDAFHAAAVADKPYRGMQKLINILTWSVDNSFQNACSVMVLTGRTERYRQQTLKWLHDNNFLVDHLLMRPDDDWRPDTDIKFELLTNFFTSKEKALERVICIFEDREKVVSMWRSNGFECLQPREGAF